MVKPGRKPPQKAPQLITSFFKPAPPSSQPSCSSSPSSQPSRNSDIAKSAVEATVDKTLRSSSASNARADPQSSLSLTSPRKPMSPTKPATSDRSASLKRARSPEPPKGSTSDNLAAVTQNVQPVQIPRRSPRKKARTSSPSLSQSSPRTSVVPSSLSDEEELATPTFDSAPTNGDAVKESVKHWRKQALPPTPEGEVSMSVDVEGFASSELSEPSTPGGVTRTLSSTMTSPRQFLTPPYTVYTASDPAIPVQVPPTPVAHDGLSKAAEIIAKIRAEAKAKAHSSPELEVDIPDFLSDSDDDILPGQPAFAPARNNVAGPSDAGPSASGSAVQPRRSTRQRTSTTVVTAAGSPISRKSRTSLLGNAMSSDEDDLPARARAPKPRARPQPAPFANLVREMGRKEKNGKGAEALKKAESSVLGRDLMLAEMSLEDAEDELDYNNLQSMQRPLSAVSSYSIASEDVFRNIGRKALEDAEIEVEKVGTLLDSDRAAQNAKAESNLHEVEGVSLWGCPGGEDTMSIDTVDAAIPEFKSEGNCHTMRFLRQALQSQDFRRAKMILNSGVLANLPIADQPAVINDLCVLATSSAFFETPVSEAAFGVAFNLLDSLATHKMKCPVSSWFVTRSLHELGASVQRLTSAGLTVPSTQGPSAAKGRRESVLYRVVALTTRAAFAKRLILEEIPDLVVSLILVAMDPETSPELRQDIFSSLEVVCRAASPGDAPNKNAESAIAARLVALSEGFFPVNKAYMVSVLANGTSAAMSISRFVSYCIVRRLPSSYVTPESYCDPVPLAPLTDELLQPASDADPSQDTVFTIRDGPNAGAGASTTPNEYIDMKYYVAMLSTALTNVRACVDEHCRRIADANRQFGKEARETKEAVIANSELVRLHGVLDVMHGRINDLRAAHLERSNLKAAIKQLQLRVHYQKVQFEKAWKDERSQSVVMKNWLGKPKPNRSA